MNWQDMARLHRTTPRGGVTTVFFFNIVRNGFFTLAVLAVAALWDLRVRRIPNWLTLGLALTLFVTACLTHGVSDALSGLVFPGLLLAAGLLTPRGWIGMGDIKLLGALGYALGVPLLILLTFVTALLITVVEGLRAAARRIGLSRSLRTPDVRENGQAARVPMAPYAFSAWALLLIASHGWAAALYTRPVQMR